MDLTADDIKAWLDGGGKLPFASELIGSGTLTNSEGAPVEYELRLGWDLAIARLCDTSWGAFNISLVEHLAGLQVSESELTAILDAVQLDDGHWSWFDKSAAYRGEAYKWFFVLAEGMPQAACLIFHPKPSAIDACDIFYIEYVAVAPWNRVNPLCERKYKGLGKLIIQVAASYAVQELKYRAGYSLHALPKAVAFYQSLGMQPFPELDKDELPYFEMPESKCGLHEEAA